MKSALTRPEAAPGPTPQARVRRAGWALALALPAALLVGVVLPPFVPEAARGVVMAGFHLVCHQIPARSFAVDGVPLAVCHRDTGLLAGMILGALLLPLLLRRLRPWLEQPKGLLAVALLPMLADWGLTAVGLWENTPLSRTATGAWAGLGLGLLLAWALAVHRAPHPKAARAVG